MNDLLKNFYCFRMVCLLFVLILCTCSAKANIMPPSAQQPQRSYTSVVTPNGRTLPFKIVNGVKVFHLIPQEVMHEFAPGLKALCWGYNDQVHGPTIEAVEGDRVRIYVTNKLPAPTTVHWHGLIVPSGMDGVSGLSQPPIMPGKTFVYEFTLGQHGTFMYHSHHDSMTQEALGLTGMFVVHPLKPEGPKVDRDFAIMLHEWRVDPDTTRPNPLEMTDFNVLTMNGKVYPATAPLVIRQGERVRIRFGNLSPQDHHTIHFHGLEFVETAMDGSAVPLHQQRKGNTLLVGVGQTRDIEFVANNPGDWVFHCHMLHHMMNQMGHKVPNMVGVSSAALDKKMRPILPSYMTMGTTGMASMMGMNMPKNTIAMLAPRGPFGSDIDMGGMANILKIRPVLTQNEDPGWYQNPEGTLAREAEPFEITRDDIKMSSQSKVQKAPSRAHQH